MTTNVQSPVRIGIIGGGGIANAHLKGYAQIPDRVTITAIADASEETLARRVEETGATGYSDFTEMVKDPNVDAVDICLPTTCTPPRSSRQPRPASTSCARSRCA